MLVFSPGEQGLERKGEQRERKLGWERDRIPKVLCRGGGREEEGGGEGKGGRGERNEALPCYKTSEQGPYHLLFSKIRKFSTRVSACDDSPSGRSAPAAPFLDIFDIFKKKLITEEGNK
jgi:hypothetical protein